MESSWRCSKSCYLEVLPLGVGCIIMVTTYLRFHSRPIIIYLYVSFDL
jgi:hypothetical protein